MDRLDADRRSALMSRVRNRDTDPELRVRRAAHALGLRFRLHRTDLPGTPDIVFPKHRVAILVHGCFWHSHPGCKRASVPKSRADFWRSKLARNVQRDNLAIVALCKAGWRAEVVWECETKRSEILLQRLHQIFGGIKSHAPISPQHK